MQSNLSVAMLAAEYAAFVSCTLGPLYRCTQLQHDLTRNYVIYLT